MPGIKKPSRIELAEEGAGGGIAGAISLGVGDIAAQIINKGALGFHESANQPMPIPDLKFSYGEFYEGIGIGALAGAALAVAVCITSYRRKVNSAVSGFRKDTLDKLGHAEEPTIQ